MPISMTPAEFLTHLARVRDQFEWSLAPSPASLGASRIRHPIRAVPKGAPQLVLDPLGAVCFVRHRTTLGPSDWARAGDLLGLAAPGDIAAAANDQTWAGVGASREPIEYLQKLRDRMARAVGLGHPLSC
jgi:hypothetical protein